MSKTMIIIVLAISTAIILYLCFLSIKLMRSANKQVQLDKNQARLQQQTDAKQIEQERKAGKKK